MLPIRLTRHADDGQGCAGDMLWLNPDCIGSFEPIAEGKGTLVRMSTGANVSFVVKESCTSVLLRLKQAASQIYTPIPPSPRPARPARIRSGNKKVKSK